MGRKDKRIPLEDVATLQVGAKMRLARQQKNVTLTDLASKLGYTKSHLSSVENGVSRPSLDLVQKYEQELGLEPDELRQLFDGLEAGQQYSIGSPKTQQVLERATSGYENREDALDEDQRRSEEMLTSNSAHSSSTNISFPDTILYDAPRVELFCGRDDELAELEEWIIRDQAQLVLVYGLGGMGKTTLTARFFHQKKNLFDYIAWFSLQDSPTLEEVLVRCIRDVFADKHTKLPTDIDGLLRAFAEYLHLNRCLVVLDNFESVLPEGRHVDWTIQKKYENYGKLLKNVVAAEHKSCLILTGREKPRGFSSLEAKTIAVHSLPLTGVGLDDVKEMLREKNLSGLDEEWFRLINKYSGNPLALKLVADPINEVFFGDIAAFLDAGEGVSIFDDLYELLDQQFERLSNPEREVIYWLAISLEPIFINDLLEDIASPMSNRELLETLSSLLRRSMIENVGAARFGLQPVIREYITDRLVNEACDEINAEELNLLGRHALVQAQTKEYIRENQVRIILTPLMKRLQTTLSRQGYGVKLKKILDQLRTTPSEKCRYAAGNILNLLIASDEAVSEYDFSHLNISQAFLQGASLTDANFAYANFEKSIFTDTFGSVLSIALNPAGSLLAAGTMNCEVRIWQISDGTLSVTCQGHTDWVRSIAFSPDGSTIVSASEDTMLRIWDVKTGQCLKTLTDHTKRVYTVAFSPDGKLIASGGEDGTILLWDTKTWQSKAFAGHNGSVRSVAFSPDGTLLASGSADETIRIWNVQREQCVQIVRGHNDGVRTLAFSHDGTFLAFGCNNTTVQLWQVGTEQEPQLLGRHRDRVYAVAFSSDKSAVASGSEDRTVRLWKVGTTGSLKTLEGHSDRVRSVAFARGGEVAVSGSEDHTIRFWDLNSGQCVKKLQGYSGWVHSVRFNHKGTVLAVGGEDWRVRLWRANNGSFQLYKTLEGHEGRIRSVAFNPSDTIVASGSEDGTVRLWDVETGRLLKTLSGHADRVWSIDFSPLGKVIASGSEDQTIRLWEVRTGEELKQWDAHHTRVRVIAFSPDGTVVASGGEDQTIRFWKNGMAQNHKEIQLPAESKNIWSIAFSPDGKLIASGSEDGVLRLWNVQTRECLRVMAEHEGRIWSVAFNTAGTLLVSGSEDGAVRVWEGSTGKNIAVLSGHLNRVRAVSFQPSNQEQAIECIASGSHDGAVKLWYFPMDTPPETLRSDRPYERMDITDVGGINTAQKAILRILGAVENVQGGNLS